MVGILVTVGQFIHCVTYSVSQRHQIYLHRPAGTANARKGDQLFRRAEISVHSQGINRRWCRCGYVYVTRVQKERFTNQADYERLKLRYILKADQLKGKRSRSCIRCLVSGKSPLMSTRFPNAAYFRQGSQWRTNAHGLTRDVAWKSVGVLWRRVERMTWLFRCKILHLYQSI